MKIEFLDVAIPFLGAFVFLKPFFSKTQLKWHNYLEIGIGIAIMGCSIYSSMSNSQATKDLQSSLESSNRKSDILIAKRIIDSTDNSNFQRYLRDSLGIQVLDITTNNVSLNNTYYQIIKNPPTTNIASISVSENYGFSLSKSKDSLIVFPKSGIWIKPFLSYETYLESKNQNIYQSDVFGSTESTTIFANNKKYVVSSIYMTTSRSKERPIIMDISGARNQSIFFGDDADAEKRYLYDDGRVYWVPNTSIGK